MLSIIIVSWNVKGLLKKCLESIFRNQNDLALEVFVVDNASTDETSEMVKNHFPQVQLISNEKNLGFAAANNQGIKQAKGDYLLLLNPDTEIVGSALKTAIDFMKSNQLIGVCGVKHLNPNGTLQPSIRRFPTFWPIFLTLTKLARIFPNLPAINKYLAKDFNYSQAQSVDQVAGSFFLIHRQVIEKIGLLDENFFIWFEEVDFCHRVIKAGWQVWYTPNASIIHYGGQRFKQQFTLKKQWLFFKSAIKYFQKYGFSIKPKNLLF